MKKLRLKKQSKDQASTTTKKEKISLNTRMNNMLASWDLKKLTKTMIIMAIPIALVGSYLWYDRLYLNDERRVWMAINNSMATPSVTRTLTSGGTGNQVVQYQQFFYSPQQVTKSKVTFSQKNATTETNVITEGVSYPEKQYSRYVLFNTNQKKQDGSSPSLDSILGRWGFNTLTEEEKQTARDSYTGELISLAIFGNFDAQFRNETLAEMKRTNVYDFDINGITRDEVEGRQVLVVPATVKLKQFATLLQSAFVKAGYGSFEPLNPDNFSDDTTLGASFMIDRKSNTIFGVQYGDRQEKYTGYGINERVVEPTSDISAEELESTVRDQISGAL